jgi:hypothetical protein
VTSWCKALEKHRLNRTAAGASLGLSLRQMRYRMARLGVQITDHGVVLGERFDPDVECRRNRCGRTAGCAMARAVPSPNFGPRPAGTAVSLAVVHSISLPPGEYGGPEIEQLFTNQLDWDAHPYFDQIRGMEVSSHFVIRRDGELLQFVSVLTTGPGMPADPPGRGATTATITRSASNWKGWKTTPSRPPQYETPAAP